MEEEKEREQEKMDKINEEKIKHLREIFKNIFSNLGRIIMDVTQPTKDIEKLKLFNATDFQISLARNLLESVNDVPDFLLSEEEKETINELRKKLESAEEVAKEVKEEEVEEV